MRAMSLKISEIKGRGASYEHDPKDLPPSLIASLAVRDFKRRNGPFPPEHFKPYSVPRYAFMSRHVRLAKSPADLVRRAIENRYEGIYGQTDRQKLALYANETALRIARDLLVIEERDG